MSASWRAYATGSRSVDDGNWRTREPMSPETTMVMMSDDRETDARERRPCGSPGTRERGRTERSGSGTGDCGGGDEGPRVWSVVRPCSAARHRTGRVAVACARAPRPRPPAGPRYPRARPTRAPSPAEMPAAASWASSSWRWVLDGGCTTSVWMLPRDAVRGGMVRPSMNAEAIARSPRSTAIRPPPLRSSPTGHGRLGMRVEARVDHPPHLGPRLERTGEDLGAGRVAVHAHVEGLHAPQHQERREGRDHAARLDLGLTDLGDEVGPAGHRTRQHVRVTADPLGGRFDDQVGTQLEGPAQVGRCERVVHDDHGAVPMGPLARGPPGRR